MKREEFEKKKNELKDYVRETIVMNKKNIFGEIISYDLQTKLTAKEKAEIVKDFQHVFVESVSIVGTIATVKFVTNFTYNDVVAEEKKMRPFTQTLLPSSYIFDEDQSVKWNREQVEGYNNGIKKLKLLDMEARKLLDATKLRSIINEVVDFYSKDKITTQSVEIVYNYLNGIYGGDVQQIHKNIYGFVDMAIEFMKLNQKKKK